MGKLSPVRSDLPQTERLTRHRIAGGLPGKKNVFGLSGSRVAKFPASGSDAPLVLLCIKQYNSPAVCRAGGVPAY